MVENAEVFHVEHPELVAEKTTDAVPIPRYRDNSIDGFGRGACFDLRVRFAMELLTHSSLFSAPTVDRTAPGTAIFALNVATELFAEAERRGLVEPFKEYEQDKNMQGHVRRQVAFQLAGQKEGAKQAQEAGGAIKPVGGGGIPFARRPN